MSGPVEKIECTVIGETHKAYQLRDGQDAERVAWFPKSEVSFDRRNINTGVAVAKIPLWLLKKEGWEE